MCVCETGWDTTMYKQKVFTGFAFSIIHYIFPIMGVVVLNKWEWVIIGIFCNEIVEETMLGLWGFWGYSADPAQDIEPRYDTLIRDIVLSAFLGTYIGYSLLNDLSSVNIFP
jgi:hypothetical protein